MDSESDSIPGLSEFVAGSITQCLELGMQLPITLAAVAVNGSLIAIRYAQRSGQDHLVTEILAENFVGSAFQLPINIMITDTTGEAVRVVIDLNGKAKVLH